MPIRRDLRDKVQPGSKTSIRDGRNRVRRAVLDQIRRRVAPRPPRSPNEAISVGERAEIWSVRGVTRALKLRSDPRQRPNDLRQAGHAGKMAAVARLATVNEVDVSAIGRRSNATAMEDHEEDPWLPSGSRMMIKLAS
jgi:hypothetical protein